MRLLRMILVAVLICSCGRSCADIRESPWAGPRPRPRVPGQIAQTDIGLPSSLESDKDAYLFITVTTNERRVALSLLARNSVDPKKVAAILQQITRSTTLPHRTTYWERAGDYSIAFQSASPMYFLSRRVDIRIPVGSLVSGIRSAGMHPHALLRVDGDSDIAGLGSSHVTLEGYRWYNVSHAPADMVAGISVPLPWSSSNLLKAIGLLSAFPLAALVCLVLAIIVAKRGRIPADRRRSWYTGIYAGGISLVLICFCVAVFTFWEKASLALLQSTCSGVVLLFVVPVEAVLMLSTLAAGWIIGMRIVPPANGADQKELFPLIPIWWIVLMVLFQQLLRLVVRMSEGFSVIVGGAIVLGFYGLWALFNSRVAWWWIKSRLALCEIHEGLSARAQETARKMGVSIKDVRIDPTEMGRCNANALVFIRHGHIVVARKMLDALGPEHLDWVIAHEIAHIKHGIPKLRIGLFTVFLTILVVGLIGLEHSDGNVYSVIAFGIFFVAMVVVETIFDMRLSRQQELAADREALIAMNNLPTAEAALMLMVRASICPQAHEKDTTHPKVSRRIEALKQTAAELGIPTELPGGNPV